VIALRSLPLAEQPPGVIDQEQAVAQREPLRHPFPRRIEPLPVLDRAERQRLFQTRRRGRARHAPQAGRLQVLGPPLRGDVIDTLLDRGMRAGLGHGGDPGRDRVQIDMRTGRQQRLFIPYRQRRRAQRQFNPS
jgi:hypothetical protein